MSLVVQKIRVSKDISREKASKIVKELGYKPTKAGPNNPQYLNFHSFRQRNPDNFIKSTFRTKIIKKNPRVYMILGKLKN